MYTSFALRSELDFPTLVWALGRGISHLFSFIAAIISYIVSLSPLMLIACKVAGAMVAVLGALAVTVLFPGLVVCGFVIVCVAVVSKPR